jgi:hypothetical protein
MAMDMNIATISLLLLLASTAYVAQSADFDVTSYGAKPGADIAQVYIHLRYNSRAIKMATLLGRDHNNTYRGGTRDLCWGGGGRAGGQNSKKNNMGVKNLNF